MRVFWVLVGLLMLGAAGWLVMARGGGTNDLATSATPATRPTAVPASAGSQPLASESGNRPAAAGSGVMTEAVQPSVIERATEGQPATAAPLPPIPAPSKPALQSNDTSPRPAAQVAPITPAESPRALPDADHAVPLTKPLDAEKPVEPMKNDKPENQISVDHGSSPAATTTPSAPAQATPSASPPATFATPTQASPPSSAVASEAPAKPAAPAVETKPDGSITVDGKYTLKGKGTKAEPYKLTWDQLVSAQDDYAPKNGRKELPARISMLNDKWVEITGYIAFPVMAESQDECLSMMNQWDGCCIGVPPTPYDAVEVHLTEAATGSNRMASYGVVRGHFKVEPQLVGGWLIGLYAMDDATMKPQTFGGIAP